MKTDNGFLHTNPRKHPLSQQEMDGNVALGALSLPGLLTDASLPAQRWSDII